MRHHVDGNRLGRAPAHREAMMANLVRSLVEHERIRTTLARAKELRRDAEKIVTLGKRGTLHARRQAFATLRDNALTRKVFDDLAPRFQERAGGYTRIIRLGRRAGDNAQMALIEYLPAEAAGAPAPAKKAKAKKAEAPVDAVKAAVQKGAREAASEAEEKVTKAKAKKAGTKKAPKESSKAEGEPGSDED